MVGQTHHRRLGREELEREVIGAIGQGIDLIRDPLHDGEVDVGGRGRCGSEEGGSWLGMMQWSQKSEGRAQGSREVGQLIRVGDRISCQDHRFRSARK